MITQAAFKKIKDSKQEVIYPVYEDDRICSKVIDRLGYDITSLVDRKHGAITKVATLGKYDFDFITFVGLGHSDDMTTLKLREAFATAFKQAKTDVAFDCKRAVSDTVSIEDVAYYATESFILSRYAFTKIGATKEEETSLALMAEADVSELIQRATDFSEPVNHARDLGNMPSNVMTPELLASYAETLAEQHGLECSILGQEQLEEMKAGALLGVNKGSELDAKMIVLRYQGDGDAPYTALVGKGLTFDSGGYNLKTSVGMKGMKYDMCGGANVLGAMEIIARRNMKANVFAIIPATENMINGEAFKCDDVLVSLSGKTIEITNTDAEGRLILCDAITYATKLGAKRIIDVATLTGACVVALGSEFTGVFSNNDEFYSEFMQAAKIQDERGWRLPTDPGFSKLLKESKVADLVNSVTGSAGASVAASFLEEFIEPGVEWIHLDIAGTADRTTDSPRNPKGATGSMARSLAQLFDVV